MKNLNKEGGGKSRAPRWTQFSMILLLAAAGIFPPLVWFNADHAGSPDWPSHAVFHLLWQAVILSVFCAVVVYAVIRWWHTEAKVRLFSTLFQIIIWSGYLISAFVLTPMANNSNPFMGATPIDVLGSDFRFIGVIICLFAPIAIYLADLRARK